MNDLKILHVSKLDAARRQLETAINLFFYEKDDVSIHTLAAAAFNILDDIRKDWNIDHKTIRQKVLNNAGKEQSKETLKSIKSAENYFKHADRDPNELIDFKPHQTLYLIADACATYCFITGNKIPIFNVFSLWLVTSEPHMFVLSDEDKYLIEDVVPKGLESKKLFFEKALINLQKMG